MSISLSTQLANQAYEVANLAGSLFDEFLNRPLGKSALFYRTQAIYLLGDVRLIRFKLVNHCHDSDCDYSANEAQILFSVLDTAEKSLERIK